MALTRRALRPILAAPLSGLLAMALSAGTASAHPLGNFTINHFTEIRIAVDRIDLDHVIDMAEIPAFQERRSVIDGDGDGRLSDEEAADYRLAACARQAGLLGLSVDGTHLALQVIAADVAFPSGTGGLSTLRLTCSLRADLELPIVGAATVAFADGSYAERIGWREVVIVGDGVAIRTSDALTASLSARLTNYPTDLLGQPLGMAAARANVAPGGPRLPDGRAGSPETVPAGRGASAVPGGVTDLVPQLTAVLDPRQPSLVVVLLAVLVAAGLGAYHAVTPGHGKTVMAAYLVGTSGRVRHALVLALTVAVSHTLGVLGLAVVVTVAQASLPPERLLPWLGAVSGAIFLAVGTGLVRARLRDVRAERAHRRAHAAGHDHHHDHAPPDAALTGRGLFVLGLSGGLVPAPSALLVFLGAIAVGRPEYGLFLVLAFGLGMAAVLGAIGVAVVIARARLGAWRIGGPVRNVAAHLQLGAALVVVVVGVAMTVQAGARLA